MRKILISIGVLIALLWSFNVNAGPFNFIKVVEDTEIAPKFGDEEPKLKRESPKVTPYADGQLYWMQMPVVCGNTKTVKEYIEENEFVLVYIGVGKQGGKDTGQPVYLISEYVTEDMKQSLSVTTTLTLKESCIMFRGFDLQFKKPPMTKGTSTLELQI
tara:strand:+ start:76 stop:552 length:477 start_codon:yes stop_codon:yes gene_type:complete